jgi:hypothetical protein
MMIRWNAEVDERARALIDAVVAGGSDRLASWRSLMALVAPHVEQWARGNRLLRRCRLAGEDDARAVMVTVLERLAADEHANLRAFRARQATADADAADAPDELIGALERLGRLEDDDSDVRAAAPPSTPVMAWMLRLVDYVARDHVRRRFGWSDDGGGPNKRDLQSDAVRLDAAPEAGARPPMTDKLTVSKLVAEVRAYMASFPDGMQRALALWLDDHGFAEIAATLELDDAEKARALVRAGQARLRERFRGRAPLFA